MGVRQVWKVEGVGKFGDAKKRENGKAGAAKRNGEYKYQTGNTSEIRNYKNIDKGFMDCGSVEPPDYLMYGLLSLMLPSTGNILQKR